MPIIRKYRVSNSKISSVAMGVSVAGWVLTVKAGPFKIKKEDLELLDDEEVTVPNFGDSVGRFSINLVRDKEDGDAIRVLADFVGQDDSVYRFPKSGRFELLHLLVDAKVLGGAASLEDASMMLWDIVEEIPND